jgi:hypothetical protein
MSWLDGPQDDREWLATDEETYDDCHTTCIVCSAPGHVPGSECPSSTCEAPDLVRHRGEDMCRACIPAFEKETDGQI